jgi:hypothetical protein
MEETLEDPLGPLIDTLQFICKPSSSGTIAFIVPSNDFDLAKAVVQKFDPSDYSRVSGIRTVAASISIQTVVARTVGSRGVSSAALSFSVDSSPPPGSNVPVVHLSIKGLP